MVESTTLQQQLIACQDGQDEAFTSVYEETKRILYQTIYLLLTNHEEAEDILHDTYVKALTHDWRRDRHANPLAWLITTAKNLALNRLKKQKRVRSVNDQDEPHHFTSHDPKPGSLLELLPQILTKDEILIVYLHLFEEWPHREIAQLMHKPLGTITWKYQEALQKIKRKVGDHHG